MATKRRPTPTKHPSPPQPTVESSEDEEEEVEFEEEERSGKQSQSKAVDGEDDSEEGDDSGEEDSESETEHSTLNRPRSATAAPTVPASATPAVASDDDDDDEGDDSGECDSETEEEQPVPNPPAATTGKPSNKDSAPESGVDAATPVKTATGESSKKLVQRIWSDVDQITLLKGMVDYIETEGKDPVANIEGFWLFIRKKLSFPVTEVQLVRKIYGVQEKYRNNHEKNRAFTKAYDAEVFKLSKKVWGSGERSLAVENGRGKKRKDVDLAVEIGGNDEVEWENETINLSMKHIGLSEDLARAKIKSMAESKRKLLVQSWKKLKADEVSTLLRRAALEVDTMKTIL